MIILEGEAERQIKNDTYEGLTVRHPLATHPRSGSPLPDYATSEAQHWNFPVEPPTKPKHRKFDSKIWRGALYALVIYVFLSLVVIIPILVVKSRSKKTQIIWPLVPTDSLWSVEDNDFSTPSQLSAANSMSYDDGMACNVWNYTSHEGNTASAHYSLPANGLVAIRSNVTYNTVSSDQISGNLTVSRNEDSSVHDVLLSVDVKFSAEKLMRQTNVCFSRFGPNRGFSIYVPNKLGKDDHLDFNINVFLPQLSAEMDKFVTLLPMLSQNFGDLVATPTPSFNQFSIEGATRPITCKSLKASQISVKNVASSIEGVFNVSSTISLDSIKGSIISDVTLTRPYMAYRPTYLTIETGDSSIKTNVTLHSPFTSAQHPNYHGFVAKVTTFNGPLDLRMKYGTNETIEPLQLQIQNNLAESTVFLDHAFQGTFAARTKMSQVTTIDSSIIPGYHPAGNTSESRTITYDQKSGDLATGWVGLGMRPSNNRRPAQSSVDIVSALSPITLTFG